MRIVLVFLVTIGFVYHIRAQHENQYEVLNKKQIRFTPAVLKNLTRNSWIESKKIYHIKGANKIYANESTNRIISFNEDGTFQQGGLPGKWKIAENNLLITEIDASSVKKTGKESMIDYFFVQKLSRKEMIIVKALDPNFKNHIVYHFRKPSGTSLGLKNLSSTELKQQLTVDMALAGRKPPANIEEMDKRALIDYAISFYSSRRGR